MTDKQVNGIANRYYDYSQGLITYHMRKEADHYPTEYAEDDLTLLSCMTVALEESIRMIATREEQREFHTIFLVIADILVNGSKHASSNSSKMYKFTRAISAKRYFEIVRSVPSVDNFGGRYLIIFNPIFAAFYFPNHICVGTDTQGEPVLTPYRGGQPCKNMTMFCSGVCHLFSSKMQRLKEAGLSIDDIKKMIGFFVVAQSASYGSVNSIGLSRVDIPYWHATIETVYAEYMENDNKNQQLKIDVAIHALFDRRTDYLSKRNQLFQSQIVHINFVGEVLGVPLTLEKFYIHEVHKHKIHQLAFEYEKDGRLVIGNFNIDHTFEADGYPCTLEAVVIAWWLRQKIECASETMDTIKNHSTGELWYETSDGWADYCSTDNSVRELAKQRSFANKIVHISPFLRRLPSSKQASQEAMKRAKGFHIELPDGYTLVKDFDRHYGGAM